MHVHANVAASSDLRVAGPGGLPVRFSGPDDMDRVHRIRADVDAVLVGVGTVLRDDPKLTARHVTARAVQPLRVVLDSTLRTPRTADVCTDRAPTLICTARGSAPATHGAADVQVVPAAPGGGLDVAAVLDVLADRGVGRVLIEGGPQVHRSFLERGLVDVFTLFIAPRRQVDGPVLFPTPVPPDPLRGMAFEAATRLDDGVLYAWRRGGAPA